MSVVCAYRGLYGWYTQVSIAGLLRNVLKQVKRVQATSQSHAGGIGLIS